MVVMIMVMDYYDVVTRALLEMSKHFLGLLLENCILEISSIRKSYHGFIL